MAKMFPLTQQHGNTVTLQLESTTQEYCKNHTTAAQKALIQKTYKTEDWCPHYDSLNCWP